jgi:hypothetical protein
MRPWHWNLLLFVLASPILVVRATVRGLRRFRVLRAAARPAIACRTCGAAISLVGLWRCGCGFTYQGHLLRVCPVCGSFPAFARCYQCQATERIAH